MNLILGSFKHKRRKSTPVSGSLPNQIIDLSSELHMKNKFIAITAMLAFSVVAQDAVSGTPSLSTDTSLLEQTLSSLNQGKTMKVTTDDALQERFQRDAKIKDLPLFVRVTSPQDAGSASFYLWDKKTNALIEPSAYTFFTKIGDKISPATASQVLAGHMMRDSNLKGYPSHNLSKNVDKKADMYVFTDATCGYCQHLENDVPTYLASGVKVHYIPYPRSGITNLDAAGFKAWEYAMCNESAPEKQAALYHELLVNQMPIPSVERKDDSCVEQIKRGYKQGVDVGVRGTPYIYIKAGERELAIPGYQSAEVVLTALNIPLKKSSGVTEATLSSKSK